MDQLSPAEKAEVEGYITRYPELRQDLREIENSLEFFSQAAALPAPPAVRTRVMDTLRDEFVPEGRTSGGSMKYFAVAMGMAMLLFGYLYWQRNGEANQLQEQMNDLRDTCQSREQLMAQRIELLQQLTLPNNHIVPFTATDGFASTDLYFHHNPVSKRNFIQVRSLPTIREDQIFELWSIKPGEAPSRMDLFTNPQDGLVEVQFVEGTAVYAITIEPAGGVDSPTMENLIGTVAVADLQ